MTALVQLAQLHHSRVEATPILRYPKLASATFCYMGVEPKIGGNTPKWMVKIMENPIKLDDLGGKPTIFGNTHMFLSQMKMISFERFWGVPKIANIFQVISIEPHQAPKKGLTWNVPVLSGHCGIHLHFKIMPVFSRKMDICMICWIVKYPRSMWKLCFVLLFPQNKSDN